MPAEPSVHRVALARLAANLAWGSVPFALLATLYPGVRLGQAATGLACSVVVIGMALVLGNRVPEDGGVAPVRFPAFRRCLSCLLLGSSLLAVPWNLQGLPCFPWAVALGFGSRWVLYGWETVELRAADREREALPCLATRMRRAVTWVTGSVIPLLIFSGLPGFPLLSLSFLLTLFAQWTVAGEQSHSGLHAARLMNPGRLSEPDSSFR